MRTRRVQASRAFAASAGLSGFAFSATSSASLSSRVKTSEASARIVASATSRLMKSLAWMARRSASSSRLMSVFSDWL